MQARDASLLQSVKPMEYEGMHAFTVKSNKDLTTYRTSQLLDHWEDTG